MKIKFLNIIALFCLTAFTVTSCLDSDEVDFTFSPNASITRFSIKNIETKVKVNMDGKDTIITKVVYGSDYDFSINQNTGEIFNVDSLPVGTDITKVVPSITADTPGIYTISDKDSIWRDGDSLNFEKPVQFKVLSYSGKFGRIYTAHVNVHAQNPDTITWNKIEGNFSPLIEKQKAVYMQDQIFVFANQNDQIRLTSTKDGKTWSPLQLTNLPAGADYLSVMAWNNQFYILVASELYVSTDGLSWEKSATDTQFKQLTASINLKESQKIMAITSDNLYTESYDGINWTSFMEMPAQFPARTHQVSYPLITNNQLGRAVVLGESLAKSDTTTVAWSLLDNEHEWTEMSFEENHSACPNFENPTLIHYNNQLYAFGGPVQTHKYTPAFKNFYSSRDHGITWKKETKVLGFPESFPVLYGKAQGNYSCIVDNENHIWIMWSKTGEVWRGRINKLGFEKQ